MLGKSVFFLSLLILTITGSASFGSDTPGGLLYENELLSAELDLAKSRQVYFVIDLASKKISIKSAGTVLADLNMLEHKVRGKVVVGRTYALLAKKSRNEPERVYIVPEREEKNGNGDEEIKNGEKNGEKIEDRSKEEKKKEGFELKALELDDMPASYRMELEGGIRVYVKSRPSTTKEKLLDALSGAGRFIARPLIFDWNYIKGRPYAEIEITMDAMNARQFYWTFSEGAKCRIK